MDDFFARKLLHWYAEHRRILPWRGTRDPYTIWISEIILQQTRVSQGYSYFLRFMERFPDVEALAAADEDDVLRCWQGLGYYSRARNLHHAARQIVGMGGFPADYERIRRLKGVGDYTAAAIASFAFGLPHAVVDGNVYRVLSRYFGIEDPIDSTAGKKHFSALAQELLPADRAADYNQALMDFGALQCLPRSPLCGNCPLEDSCAACLSGRVQQLPVKMKSQKVTVRYLHYIYIHVKGETAFFRREGNDIWRGLYEPFLVETDSLCTPSELFSADRIPGFMHGAGAVWRVLNEGLRHQLTHRQLLCNFYRLDLPEKPSDAVLGRSACWLRTGEWTSYAQPRPVEMMSEHYAESLLSTDER